MSRQSITLSVKGMTCGGCAEAVKRVVTRKDSAADVVVDLASGRVEAKTVLSAEDVAASITKAGYEARPA